MSVFQKKIVNLLHLKIYVCFKRELCKKNVQILTACQLCIMYLMNYRKLNNSLNLGSFISRTNAYFKQNSS